MNNLRIISIGKQQKIVANLLVIKGILKEKKQEKEFFENNIFIRKRKCLKRNETFCFY